MLRQHARTEARHGIVYRLKIYTEFQREKSEGVRKLLQSHVYHICDGLRIGRRARTTAVDAIMDVGQFIGYAVRLWMFKLKRRIWSG